jgi:N-acetylmuramoyl-L-alanine amidase
MDPAALAVVCALLTAGRPAPPLPVGVACPPAQAPLAASNRETLTFLAEAMKAPSARDGIARVAFAEAGNQGDSGLAAVVYAILNRLADGRWGVSVDSVLNARSQFEPVMRAGGDWRGLPAVSPAGQARIDTILNLALDGRLPDLTHGARFFQNPVIVAQRARDGTVSSKLVNFGGATPSAVIGAHSFYVDAGVGQDRGRSLTRPSASRSDSRLIVLSNEPAASDAVAAPPPPEREGEAARSPVTDDPSRALFIGRDGVVSAGPR